MRRVRYALPVFGLLVVMASSPAFAQRVDVRSRPPAPEGRLEIVPPPMHDQVTRPTDSDFYPDAPLVQHDPAFIEPLATTTATGRAGASGWTAPQTPVGPEVLGRRDVNGWLALGFSLTWGAPPPRRPQAR